MKLGPAYSQLASSVLQASQKLRAKLSVQPGFGGASGFGSGSDRLDVGWRGVVRARGRTGLEWVTLKHVGKVGVCEVRHYTLVSETRV